MSEWVFVGSMVWWAGHLHVLVCPCGRVFVGVWLGVRVGEDA